MACGRITSLCSVAKSSAQNGLPRMPPPPFEQQHPHYRAFHVKRPLPRASAPRSQIVPQLFRPRYRQHQLRSSNVQSVTDRTNVPLPPYKAIRHREGERCPLPGRRSAVASKSPVRIPPRFEGERWIPLQLSIIRYSRSLASIPISFVSIASIPMFVRLSVYPSLA